MRKTADFSTERIKKFVSGLQSVREEELITSNSLPKISVVVPSYNQGQFIERTILSIINQHYPNTEIIVIDGGSTDDTLSVLQKYEKYITYWHSEPDEGQSDALNKGFVKASGEIFAWQNSDDIYMPGAFHLAAAIFERNPGVAVCYGNWYSIDSEDCIFDTHYSLKPRIPHAPFENMDVYNQAIFWRRSALKGINTFDENLHQLMDTDLVFRLILRNGKSSFYRTTQFIGAFRWHTEQKTSIDTRTERGISEERYLERKYGFPASSTIEGVYYRIAYRLSQLFESLLSGGIKYTWRKFLITYKRRGQFI